MLKISAWTLFVLCIAMQITSVGSLRAGDGTTPKLSLSRVMAFEYLLSLFASMPRKRDWCIFRMDTKAIQASVVRMTSGQANRK